MFQHAIERYHDIFLEKVLPPVTRNSGGAYVKAALNSPADSDITKELDALLDGEKRTRRREPQDFRV